MKTIIWDVDDVLNDLTGEWYARAWVPTAPGAPPYDRLAENPPHRVLGVSLATYLASLDDFRRDCYASLAPVSEVLEWFEAHGCECTHVALSAVPPAYADLTAAWVIKHFGRWINTFAFVPPTRERAHVSAMASSKRDYLSWLGRGDVLVEDRQETITAASTLGIAGVLVPRPWNERRSERLAAALSDLSRTLAESGTVARGSDPS
jgi:hypothetical protein